MASDEVKRLNPHLFGKRRAKQKQDRTRRSGNRASLNTQDYPAEQLTPQQRLRRALDTALLIVTRQQVKDYADVTGDIRLHTAWLVMDEIRRSLPEDPLKERSR